MKKTFKQHAKLHAFHLGEMAKHTALAGHPALSRTERDKHNGLSIKHAALADKHHQAAMDRKFSGQDTSVMGPRDEHPEARLPQTNSKTPTA